MKHRFVALAVLLALGLAHSGFALAQQDAPATPIPPLTEEDRAAAFPDLGEHAHPTHDTRLFSYVLFDELEWRSGGEENVVTWSNKGWVGGDINRFWFRTEGEGSWDRVREGEAHLLYGRSISRWWDLVAGVRQDVRPSPARTWAAVGIQGLAPYFFEVEATAYVGSAWRTQLRLEAEYDMLLTNRLILQPAAEMNLAGKSDPERGFGSGVTKTEAGLRLRYEFRREFAPYIGVVWSQDWGRTADFTRAAGRETRSTEVAAGIRVWF